MADAPEGLESLRVWTTVGSAGTLNQADLAKVSLHQSIIQLGIDLSLPAPEPSATASRAAAAPEFGPNHQTIQAIVRYNVTPVDGLFFTDERHVYGLLIRCRGHIAATLKEVDFATGAETTRIQLNANSATFGPPQQQAFETISGVGSKLLDFVNKAYYVEATLTASALVVGHPAAISIIKLVASVPLH